MSTSGDATNKHKTMEAHPCKHPIKSFASSSFFVYTAHAGIFIVLIRVDRQGTRSSNAAPVTRGLRKRFCRLGTFGVLISRYCRLCLSSLQPVKGPNRVSLPDTATKRKTGARTVLVPSLSRLQVKPSSRPPFLPKRPTQTVFLRSVWATSLRDFSIAPLMRGLNS
jgi:hypothetical protein